MQNNNTNGAPRYGSSIGLNDIETEEELFVRLYSTTQSKTPGIRMAAENELANLSPAGKSRYDQWAENYKKNFIAPPSTMAWVAEHRDEYIPQKAEEHYLFTLQQQSETAEIEYQEAKKFFDDFDKDYQKLPYKNSTLNRMHENRKLDYKKAEAIRDKILQLINKQKKRNQHRNHVVQQMTPLYHSNQSEMQSSVPDSDSISTSASTLTSASIPNATNNHDGLITTDENILPQDNETLLAERATAKKFCCVLI